MAVIKRGVGFTSTEKNLAALADKIFLSLWTYPNLFGTRGKELCDLLVVCGDDVLIFSDKRIQWSSGIDAKLAWPRWYRKAIGKSVAQINGAARYLRDHTDQLFLDAGCKEKFPLAFPPTERRRLHLIAVALGASDACAEYRKEAPGYFAIDPNLKGDDHTNAGAEGFKPFAIGDVRPDGGFVHVFNEPALELLAGELDTVTDFTRYLTRRERIIRSGHLQPVEGEHELLAQYLISGGPDEEHDFRRPGGGEWQKGEKLEIPAGTYAALAAQPGYEARKEADKASYKWDMLLGLFTDSVLKGEAEDAVGKEPEPSKAEEGLRNMALEPRLSRRLLGRLVVDAMKTAEDKKAGRFARNMVPGAHSADETVGYVFLILAHHGDAPGPAYAEYRKRRRLMLRGYCLDMLQRNRDLKRAVGLGMDASPKVTGRTGGSEDIYVLQIDSWTPELEKQTEEHKKELGLLKPGNVTHGTASVDEFPRVAEHKQPAPQRAEVTVARDSKWPNMWRVRLPNGQLTDMVNLTRANDASRSLDRPDRTDRVT
jgi:hypothetical protein